MSCRLNEIILSFIVYSETVPMMMQEWLQVVPKEGPETANLRGLNLGVLAPCTTRSLCDAGQRQKRE